MAEESNYRPDEPLSEAERKIAVSVSDHFKGFSLFYYSESQVRYYLTRLHGYNDKKDNVRMGVIISEVNRLRMLALENEYTNYRTLPGLKDPVGR